MRSRGSELVGGSEPQGYVDSGYSLSVRPRVGYVIRLTDDIALWPRVGVGYDVSRTEVVEGPAARALSKTYTAELELGIIARLGKHAYINVGPTLGYASTSTEASTPIIEFAGTDTSSVEAGARATFGLVL